MKIIEYDKKYIGFCAFTYQSFMTAFCVLCRTKMRCIVDAARNYNGHRAVATGHYNNGRHSLWFVSVK